MKLRKKKHKNLLVIFADLFVGSVLHFHMDSGHTFSRLWYKFPVVGRSSNNQSGGSDSCIYQLTFLVVVIHPTAFSQPEKYLDVPKENVDLLTRSMEQYKFAVLAVVESAAAVAESAAVVVV